MSTADPAPQYDGTSPFSGRTDLSPAEVQHLAERFKGATVATPIWHEAISAPTAWQSIPKPVRFSVWVWAVCVILGLIGALVGVLVWVLVFGAALSQL